MVFQANIKVNTFSWSKIVKISFKRKQFFIQLRKEISESYDTLLGEQSYIILIRIIPLSTDKDRPASFKVGQKYCSKFLLGRYLS